MRALTLLLSLSLVALVGCSDDPDTVPADDTGATDAADSGSDVGADSGTDTGGTCESEVECVRLSDCTRAGIVNPSCDEGCCVEGGGTVTPDAGGGEGCGDITFQGECDGNVVTWCDNDSVSTVDCTDFYASGTGTCAWFGDDFGYWCGLADDDPCIDAEGNIQLCAGGEGVGCVATDGDDFSVACTQAEFDACDEETFGDPVCDRDYLIADCVVNHPLAWDCASFGGTCADGLCVGATEGATCTEDLVACAEGLECVEGDDGLTTCQPAAEPTCDDEIQNGDEEGVDCGGSCPDECPAEPTCDDEIQNGDEEGVDCGGSCPDECPAEPTCDDEIQNGDEEGVDCGGSCPDACEA